MKNIKTSLIIISSTSFLLILTLASIHILLKVFYSIRNNKDLYKNHIHGRPELIDIYKKSGFSIADTKEILKNAHRFSNTKSNFIYDSFLGFRERPRETRFVNISKHGFRRNSNLSPSDNDLFNPNKNSKDISRKNISKKTIYFFGASTAFGYGVSDNQTIPAYMEKIDPKLQVFNFGRGYYYSEQQNYLLDRLINSGAIKPKIAIFMQNHSERGGIYFYEKEMESLFESVAKDSYSWEISEFAKPLFFILSKLDRRKQDDNEEGDKYYSQYDLKKMTLTEVFEKNLISRDFICKKHKIKCITIIEPHSGEHSNQIFHSQEKKESLNKFFSKLKQVDHEYLDFTKVLAKNKMQAFVDYTHFSPDSHKIIAEEIVKYFKQNDL